MRRLNPLSCLYSYCICVLLVALTAGAPLANVKSYQAIGDGTGGFTGDLDDQDRFGNAAALLGDLDGDGVVDIAVGAYFDDDGGDNRGAVWILFLNSDGTTKTQQKISDTQGGFTGALDDSDFFGRSIASLGDLDGDGVVDLAVGAWGDDYGATINGGAVWILFLNDDGTVKSHQKISNAHGGFTGSLGSGDTFGSSVSLFGDLNGDSIPDLAVGAPGDSDNGIQRGAVWILFMNDDGTVKSHQKINETAGNFTGDLDNDDRFGHALTALDDVDGDGNDDLAVGAFRDDDGGASPGAVWILFLKDDGTVKSHQKISNTQGGFTGALDNNDGFGSTVARLGDIDGDGAAEIVTGAPTDDDGGTSRGAVWILSLNSDGTVKFHLKISDASRGFSGVLSDGELFGTAVAPLGDFNSDGLDDLVVGAYGSDLGGTDTGVAYILLLSSTCTVGPASIDFGPVVVGDSVDRQFLIKNGQFGTLSGSVTESCPDFEILSGDGPYALAPGESLVVDVRFAPTIDGPLACSVSTGSACNDVLLSGTAHANSTCTVVPWGLDFGSVVVGSSADRQFLIRNSQLGTLSGSVTESCPDVEIISGGGPYALPPGESLVVVVRFAPTTGGPLTCIVSTGSACNDVLLTGTAPPICRVVPWGLDFGLVFVGSSADRQFLIRNGQLETLGGSVTESCPDVEILSGGGPYALATGDSLVVDVRFAPTTDGPLTCIVSTGSACNDVLLTGTAHLTCVVEPTSIDFGLVFVGSLVDRQFLIRNGQPETLGGSVTESCPDVEILSGGGPFDLAPGDSLVVVVRFKPTTEGALACIVSTGSVCGDVLLGGTAQLGPAPHLTSVADPPNDEGRSVVLTFLRSALDDAGSLNPIVQYEAYRRIDPLPSMTYGPLKDLESRIRRARGAGMISDPGLLSVGWDYLAAISANLILEYNMAVPTLADSSGQYGIHWSVFFVRAATAIPSVFFDSVPDSGYSLDNLFPPPVTGFAVAYNTENGTYLTWDPSVATDFDTFHIYRDATPGFTPGPVTLVHSTSGTQWLDTSSYGGQYYQITAVDSSGNESDPAVPGTATGIPEMTPSAFRLHQNVPNPFNPTTLISYDVPAPGARVTIRVYDVQGAFVRTLVDRWEAAGSKTEPWDGRDHRGREVSTGVYFCRMQADGFSQTRKMVLMR